jgi:hypothetical protein
MVSFRVVGIIGSVLVGTALYAMENEDAGWYISVKKNKACTHEQFARVVSAIDTGDVEQMQNLINEGIKVHAIVISKHTSLLYQAITTRVAADENKKKMIDLLYKYNAYTQEGEQKETILIDVARSSDAPDWVIPYLLNKDPKLKNKQDHYGDTAIMRAALNDNIYGERVLALIIGGCSTRVKNKEGKTALNMVEDQVHQANFNEDILYYAVLQSLLQIAEEKEQVRIKSMYCLCLINSRALKNQSELPPLPNEILVNIRDHLKALDTVDIEKKYQEAQQELTQELQRIKREEEEIEEYTAEDCHYEDGLGT